MRAINVLLSLLISLLIGALVLEGGLRLIGYGPKTSLVAFDAETGWSNVPGREKTFRKGPIVAHREINAVGLRDDPFPEGPKPDGVYRIVALGDSFTLGYSVERDDHFVDIIERTLREEGRPVEVWNAGTEGWDTAQQAAWLEEHGQNLDPDLVLLFPYENDLYWNSQTSYATPEGPRQKPRYKATGEREERVLEEPAPKPWHQKWALTKWLGKDDQETMKLHSFRPPGSPREIARELAPLLTAGTEFDASILAHTGGALDAIKNTAHQLGAELVMAPIPGATKYEDHWRKVYRNGRGLGSLDWSPDKPVDTFLTLAQQRSIPTIDVRPALDVANDRGDTLYWEDDWHFDKNGNRVFADALMAELGNRVELPATTGDATTLAALEPPAKAGMPFALKLYLGLWAGLSALYLGTYRDEAKWMPPIKIALLLGAVFAIFIGIMKLQDVLPPPYGGYLPLAFLVVILGFVAWKLGNRLSTISELIGAFIRRGHWYLMPLVVVLLSIGSLLVVAASSPLVAPFIYTLF